MASRPRWTRARLVSAAALSVGAFWTTACDFWGEPHSEQDAMNTERVECPRHWARLPLYFDKRPHERIPRYVVSGSRGLELHPPNGVLPASGPITNIPEFHDCQRFVSRDGAKFDSLFAIFASFKLDSLTRALGWEQVVWSSSNPAVATVDATGRITGIAAGTATITATSIVDMSRTGNVAVIVTAPNPNTPSSVSVPSNSNLALSVGQAVQAVPQIGKPTDNTLAAATIYSYGPGYSELDIGPNFNCLYLYFDNTATLRAKMVHVDQLAEYPTACLDAVDPKTAPGQSLSITKSPPLPPEDIPPVARWDRDPISHRYYVGIQCGDSWCEIGREGMATSKSYLAELAPTSDDQVVRVKGWYDEQELAWHPSEDGPPVPSGILGTVIPAANLGSLVGKPAFESFVTVAYVALDVTSASPAAVTFYKTKLNLNPASVLSATAPAWDPTRLNKLELCFGTQEACNVTWTTERENVRCAATNVLGYPVHRWWVRITAAGESVAKYRCATRRDHTNYASMVAATARWRWIIGDDTIWAACTKGCCQVETDD